MSSWPSTKEEAWRYFPTRALQDHDLAAPMGVVAVDVGHAEARLVIVNGVLDRDQSALPDGVTLEDAPRGDGRDGLVTANLSYGQGVRVRVAKKTSATLEVLYVTRGDGVVHPRLDLCLDTHAELRLLQRFVGAGRYFVNSVTDIHMAPDTRLAHVKLETEDPQASHIDAVTVHVGGDARYHGFTLSLGATRARTAPFVTLAAPGAEAEVDGLYLGDGEQVLDHTMVMTHAAPHTTSRATWAGVLDGKSTGTFQGLIVMKPAAVKGKTRELTRTLLLSDSANANAKPELHIDVDDVEASHGATVGSLDAAQMFYLAARGIAPEVARKMLIGAFVRETVALAPALFRPAIEAALKGRLADQHDGDGDDASL